MAEEYKVPDEYKPDVCIKKCAQGFLVTGATYGDVGIRAFSTSEGLIEWLARELGAGPIVWAWTLPVWAEMVGVKVEDILDMPDPSVDPTGYREAQEHNATFLITRFADKVIEARTPKPLPEPKPKKEKKAKEEKSKEKRKPPEDEPSFIAEIH